MHTSRPPNLDSHYLRRSIYSKSITIRKSEVKDLNSQEGQIEEIFVKNIREMFKSKKRS